MRKLLKEWRQFLNEEETAHKGILMIKINSSDFAEVKALQSDLPEDAVPLDQEDLHVTLLHQSTLKPFVDQLEKVDLPVAPRIKLKNQDEMKNYVQKVMELLGSQNTNPEPERVFHISLANLTGNPGDSVR